MACTKGGFHERGHHFHHRGDRHPIPGIIGLEPCDLERRAGVHRLELRLHEPLVHHEAVGALVRGGRAQENRVEAAEANLIRHTGQRGVIDLIAFVS